MHAVLTAAMEAAASHHLTTREALSGIWGSISLCAWIFLLVSSPRLETHMEVARAVHARAIAVEGEEHTAMNTDTAVFESRKAGAQEPAATHVVLLRPASTQKARDRSQSSS